MNLIFPTITGKTVRFASRLRGGGSALPGLVVEKMSPQYLNQTLNKLPYGVVIISGTNGKTTTTKITCELLQSAGLKVFTNNTGSNFVRGVISSMLEQNTLTGKLDADIAVLELDEAHAIHFIKQIKPTYSLLLNVEQDQLERFGDINYTASLLEKIALATTKKVIINREDPLLINLVKTISPKRIAFFGASSNITYDLFKRAPQSLAGKNLGPLLVELVQAKNDTASFTFYHKQNKDTYKGKLKLKGLYNYYNATAALALVRQIVSHETTDRQLVKNLSSIEPAFGRSESITYQGEPIEIVLVKNASGFNVSLDAFDSSGFCTLIALNDAHADGRDISWIKDVDFTGLKNSFNISLTGTRAKDLQLHLIDCGIKTLSSTTDIETALNSFLKQCQGRPKRIFCSYTAMLEIRRRLQKVTELKNIGVR